MTGYHRIAEFMSAHGDVAIIRRFGKLNMLNLLYMQADLTRLEDQLSQIANQNPNITAAKDWVTLCESAQDQDQLQHRLTLEMREKLGRFNAQLLQQADLMKLSPPNRYNIAFLRTWLTDIAQGDFPLLGRDRYAWDNSTDLISLQPPRTHGPFSYALTYKVVPYIYSYLGSDHSGDRQIADSKLATAVEILGCVTASLLPLTSILALYLIHDELKRLFAIVGFTGLFCLAVLLLTHARLIEVFAATSAFSAVLVVYVSRY